MLKITIEMDLNLDKGDKVRVLQRSTTTAHVFYYKATICQIRLKENRTNEVEVLVESTDGERKWVNIHNVFNLSYMPICKNAAVSLKGAWK